MLKSYDEMTPDQQLAYKMGRDSILKSFPTDEMVEAAQKAVMEGWGGYGVLEAVRRLSFQEDNDDNG